MTTRFQTTQRLNSIFSLGFPESIFFVCDFPIRIFRRKCHHGRHSHTNRNKQQHSECCACVNYLFLFLFRCVQLKQTNNKSSWKLKVWHIGHLHDQIESLTRSGIIWKILNGDPFSFISFALQSTTHFRFSQTATSNIIRHLQDGMLVRKTSADNFRSRFFFYFVFLASIQRTQILIKSFELLLLFLREDSVTAFIRVAYCQ